MKRKVTVALTVFALAFATAGGVSSAENDPVVTGATLDIAGQTHVAVQGTDWVAERPQKFRRWKAFAWGVETRAKEATQEWVHIPIPTLTFVDSTALKVMHLEFCAKTSAPKRSKPIAIHIWANQKRVYTETIVWPVTQSEYCHKVDFSPPIWMESVGVSVLVNYANRRNKVTLTKAWISLVP
jgi:hypothetical protein